MSNSRLTSPSSNLIGPCAFGTRRLSAPWWWWWWWAGLRENEAPTDVTEVAAGGSGRKTNPGVFLFGSFFAETTVTFATFFFFFLPPLHRRVKRRLAGGGRGGRFSSQLHHHLFLGERRAPARLPSADYGGGLWCHSSPAHCGG